MTDVVAVVLDAAGAVRFVLTKYGPSWASQPVDLTIPVSKLPPDPFGFLDPVVGAQWTYPARPSQSALRFQSDADLGRIPTKLKTPGGIATFMDTSEYEAWVVMLRLAEA